MNLTAFGQVYDRQNRDFLSVKHQRFAEILHDYSPNLSLVYIPSHDRDETDTKPFAILDTPSDTSKAPYIVRYLSEREMDDPEEILLWIWEGDFKKHSPDAIFNRLEAKRIAQELVEKKNEMEDREERIDLMTELARGGRDGLHYYRHDGRTFRR